MNIRIKRGAARIEKERKHVLIVMIRMMRVVDAVWRRRNAFCGFQLSSESYAISTERNRKQNNFLETSTTKLVGNVVI